MWHGVRKPLQFEVHGTNEIQRMPHKFHVHHYYYIKTTNHKSYVNLSHILVYDLSLFSLHRF